MFEPAPLVDIPEAPVPPGAEPGWFTGVGGAKLRAALFTPRGTPRGSVVLSGGRTEPIEKYFEVIEDFLDRGFVVLAHDWRGQGLSARELPDRLKGHARGFRSFLEDYQRLLDAYEPRLPRPWIAVGHSMGGCLTLLALAHGEPRFAGACLSAPMLGLQLGKISPLAAGAMTWLNLSFGRAGRYTSNGAGKPYDEAFEGNALTHDRRRFERHRAQIRANPDLALGGPTWGWLDFAFKATAYLAHPERLRGVTIPVEILSAADDTLVDNAAQAAAARNLPQGRLITVPGAYHEILMETDDMRNFFLRVFDTLTGKTAPKPAEAPKPAATPAAAPPEATAPRPASNPAPAPAAAATRASKPATAKKPAAKKATPKKAAAPKAAAPKAAAKPAAAKTPAARKAAPAKAAKPAAAKKPTTSKRAAPAKAAAKSVAKTVAPSPAAPKKLPAKRAAKPAAKPATSAPAAKPAAAAKSAAARKAVAKKPAARKPPAKK